MGIGIISVLWKPMFSLSIFLFSTMLLFAAVLFKYCSLKRWALGFHNGRGNQENFKYSAFSSFPSLHHNKASILTKKWGMKNKLQSMKISMKLARDTKWFVEQIECSCLPSFILNWTFNMISRRHQTKNSRTTWGYLYCFSTEILSLVLFLT